MTLLNVPKFLQSGDTTSLSPPWVSKLLLTWQNNLWHFHTVNKRLLDSFHKYEIGECAHREASVQVHVSEYTAGFLSQSNQLNLVPKPYQLIWVPKPNQSPESFILKVLTGPCFCAKSSKQNFIEGKKGSRFDQQSKTWRFSAHNDKQHNNSKTTEAGTR